MKKALTFLLALALFPSFAFAAITFDKSSVINGSGTITPTSGGANNVLIITNSSSGSGSTCTVGGVACKLISNVNAFTTRYIQTWYFIGATVGSANAIAVGGNQDGTVASYFGVNQTTPIFASSTIATNVGTTFNLTVASANTCSWIYTAGESSGGNGPTTNSMTFSPTLSVRSGQDFPLWDSNAAVASTSYTQTYTSTAGSVTAGFVLASLNSAACATATVSPTIPRTVWW